MFYRLRRIRRFFPIKLHVEYLYRHDLNGLQQFNFDALKADFPINILTSQQVDSLQDVWPVDVKAVQARLQRGDKCYVTTHQGKLMSYHWVQNHGEHFLQQANRYYSIADEQIWIYHVRVSEEVRGKGINKMVYAQILADAAMQGKREVLIYTASTNVPNQRSLATLGFKRVRDLVSMRSGSNYFSLFSKSVN